MDSYPGFSESRLNEGPLESFRILVGGHEIPTQMSRVALVGNLDVTQQLHEVGLSDKQIFETFGDCRAEDDGGTVICGIADEKRAEIVRHTGNSNWKVAETAYWEQVFPAMKEIEVSHEYQPFVGRSYDYSGIPGDAKESCMDDGTQRAIAKNIDSLKAKGGDAVVSLDVVEYILGTGRNWKGPIKNFKLILKKDSPNQIVSLCFPGKAKRTSASTIEFVHSNFVPQDKLVVYFYTVATKVLAPPDER